MIGIHASAILWKYVRLASFPILISYLQFSSSSSWKTHREQRRAIQVDSIVDSQSAAQSYPSGFLEHCYQTGTSHISKDLSVTRKVDVEEDDSQYEDGELRESGDRYGVDDGYEEVKCDNHQVSYYKNENAAPDIHLAPVQFLYLSTYSSSLSWKTHREQRSREQQQGSARSSDTQWSWRARSSGKVARGAAARSGAGAHGAADQQHRRARISGRGSSGTERRQGEGARKQLAPWLIPDRLPKDQDRGDGVDPRSIDFLTSPPSFFANSIDRPPSRTTEMETKD